MVELSNITYINFPNRGVRSERFPVLLSRYRKIGLESLIERLGEDVELIDNYPPKIYGEKDILKKYDFVERQIKIILDKEDMPTEKIPFQVNEQGYLVIDVFKEKISGTETSFYHGFYSFKDIDSGKF